MSRTSLPKGFIELEPYVAWALPSERERNTKRNESEMPEIQSFYDAIFPQMDRILEYLNQFPLNDLPAPEQRLLYLSLSLAEIANAVELFRNPGVVDGFPIERFMKLRD